MRDMSASIYEVLDELRGQSTSEADKGSKLEQLIAEFLRTDPVYAEQFSDVWLWQEWPGRDGKHDTGIDLVAVDRIGGGNVAIQCKFYAPGSTIGKADIDSFLSASGKEGFAQRIIVSTTDRWNAHAEDAIQGQQAPAGSLPPARRRRGRVHPLRTRGGEPVLPARLLPLRTRLPHRHQQQALRPMG